MFGRGPQDPGSIELDEVEFPRGDRFFRLAEPSRRIVSADCRRKRGATALPVFLCPAGASLGTVPIA
jgi:hypothetical protein